MVLSTVDYLQASSLGHLWDSPLCSSLVAPYSHLPVSLQVTLGSGPLWGIPFRILLCILSKLHVHVSLGHVPRVTRSYDMQIFSFCKEC